MNLEQVKLIHELLVDKSSWVLAANAILRASEISGSIATFVDADAVIRKFLQGLLDDENYAYAATLMWGQDMFTVEPESVQRVLKAISDNNKVLLCGAASMSKTFSAGAWMYLDWRKDPEYTNVKLAAVNEDHLRKNLFSHVLQLHKNAVIPVTNNDEQEVLIRDSDLYLGLKSSGMGYGISGIAFKQSQDSSGQFKGYKPQPMRKIAHPIYGKMTRLRVLGDEGQNWPDGPFKDFNSVMGSMSGKDLVKIVVAFNPEDMSQAVVQKAEPPEGWLPDFLDTLYDWESKEGWHVTRLDAAKSENVLAKKVLYPGLQTYEGYMGYLKSPTGDTSPAYYCFARGYPPLKGATNTIIPASWPLEQRGEAVFIDKPIYMASIDLAYQGADTIQMVVGRWGLAKGWRRQSGKYEEFIDRTSPGRKKPHHVLQIDQVIALEKSHDTIQAAEEIMARCKMMGIDPKWVVIDRSGMGEGTYSHLKKYWSSEVLGISWGEGATDLKVLAEDTEPASSRFQGIMSEMWFAFRIWLDPVVCAIILNPIIPSSPINLQLSTRRFRYAKASTMKVESKEEYKARNNKSPDEADSCIQLVQLVRQRSQVLPGLVEEFDSSQHKKGAPINNPNPDDDDSISASGNAGDYLDMELVEETEE